MSDYDIARYAAIEVRLMSEILADLKRMHNLEAHLIRGSRISIQVQPFKLVSKYILRPFSLQTDEEQPIPANVMIDNISGIQNALTQVSGLIENKGENTITYFDFDDDGRLHSYEHQFVSPFRSVSHFRKIATRMLQQLVPIQGGFVEIKVGPISKTTYPTAAELSGSIIVNKFRFMTDSEEDKRILEMNSYVLTSYLPKIMKHSTKYKIFVEEEGSLGSPIPIPSDREYKS